LSQIRQLQIAIQLSRTVSETTETKLRILAEQLSYARGATLFTVKSKATQNYNSEHIVNTN